MIVLTPYSYTFNRNHYITTYNGEMVGTIKFPRKGKDHIAGAGRMIGGAKLDYWVSSQPKSVLNEGSDKLRAYLDAGGHPKDSFKKLGQK